MDISIRTVPNKEIQERAGFTGADWWFDRFGNIQVRVAEEIGDWQEEFILAMHEAAEAGLCKRYRVNPKDVDVFDSRYQREHTIDTNAGDESDAPYKLQHTFATAIERILAGAMNIDWKRYDDKLSVI